MFACKILPSLRRSAPGVRSLTRGSVVTQVASLPCRRHCSSFAEPVIQKSDTLKPETQSEFLTVRRYEIDRLTAQMKLLNRRVSVCLVGGCALTFTGVILVGSQVFPAVSLASLFTGLGAIYRSTLDEKKLEEMDAILLRYKRIEHQDRQ